MSEITTTQDLSIRDWPPNIDWTLLDGGASDPSVPRRFLKEESWKLLLASAPKPSLKEDESGRFTFIVPVYIPNNLEDFQEVWLGLMLRSVIRCNLQKHASAVDPTLTKIEFEAAPIEQLEPLRREALQRNFRDRSLQDWLLLYVKGLYFASQIGRTDQDRYVFIEEVYFPTEHYLQAKANYLLDYHQPVLIKGIPRAGKTYTSLRLLYEALDDSEASIKLISTWSDPTDLLDVAADSGGKLFVLFDDPFGVDEYNDNVAATSLDVIERLFINYPNVRLLITTRDEVYRVAKDQLTSLRSFPNTEINFIPDSIAEDITLYPEVLERTAWLHGANWLSEYRRYLNKEHETEAQESVEIREAWQLVLQQSYVPGVFLSAFILYPQIINLDVQDPVEVRNLALALERAVDVRAAFRSELDALLTNARSEAVLYLLLPSLTLVQEETLNRVFTGEELNQLTEQWSQYFEATFGDDFAVYSYRYKLDVFAEVAQDVMEAEGLAFLEQSILPELAKRVLNFEIPAELIADVLTRYFWLGGRIGNQNVVTLMEALTHYSQQSAEPRITLQRDQVYVLGALFQREKPKLGFDLLVRKLTEADPLLVSNVASILDQLLTTQIRERMKLVQRVGRVVHDLHERYFGLSETDESALRASLQASLLLHGVLSHLENYFEANREACLTRSLEKEPSPELQRVEAVFRELIGADPLLQRIKQREGDWVRPALMWLDAIIMKLGELLLYLVEHDADHKIELGKEEQTSNKTVPSSFIPPEAVVQRNVACVLLKNHLRDELDRVTETIKEKAGSKELLFLSGGLLFTLAWHNRWCLADNTSNETNEIARWAIDSGLLHNSWDQPEFWEGIYFNIAYHAKYFEVKASAWQRESAIYRLHHEKGPRLGADTLHESGLSADKQLENWKPRFTLFYRNCLDRILSYDSTSALSISPVSPSIVEQASFLFGMRAPREPSLQDEYIERVKSGLVKNFSWRHGLLRAVTKLYAFNLRDSIGVVEKAISLCGTEAIQRASGSLLEVIDEVEREFKEGGGRYAAVNINKLRRRLGAGQQS